MRDGEICGSLATEVEERKFSAKDKKQNYELVGEDKRVPGHTGKPGQAEQSCKALLFFQRSQQMQSSKASDVSNAM